MTELSGKRIVMTGATGFIGSHVAKRFLEAGAEVYCLVRPESQKTDCLPVHEHLILDALFNKFKTASIGDLISIMDDILPLVSTNLTNNEIISIVTTVLGMGMPHIEQASFPSVEKTKTIYTDMLHLTIDTDEITNDIHNFLYSSN